MSIVVVARCETTSTSVGNHVVVSPAFQHVPGVDTATCASFQKNQVTSMYNTKNISRDVIAQHKLTERATVTEVGCGCQKARPSAQESLSTIVATSIHLSHFWLAHKQVYVQTWRDWMPAFIRSCTQTAEHHISPPAWRCRFHPKSLHVTESKSPNTRCASPRVWSQESRPVGMHSTPLRHHCPSKHTTNPSPHITRQTSNSDSISPQLDTRVCGWVAHPHSRVWLPGPTGSITSPDQSPERHLLESRPQGMPAQCTLVQDTTDPKIDHESSRRARRTRCRFITRNTSSSWNPTPHHQTVIAKVIKLRLILSTSWGPLP